MQFKQNLALLVLLEVYDLPPSVQILLHRPQRKSHQVHIRVYNCGSKRYQISIKLFGSGNIFFFCIVELQCNKTYRIFKFYSANWSLFWKSYHFLFYLGLNCKMIKQENLERKCTCQLQKTFLLLSALRCTRWNVIKLQQSSGKILFLKHSWYFHDLFLKLSQL